MGKNCVDLDSSPPTRGGVSSRQDYEHRLLEYPADDQQFIYKAREAERCGIKDFYKKYIAIGHTLTDNHLKT